MRRGLGILLLLALVYACKGDGNTSNALNKTNKDDVLAYVNPFIGTDGPGNTYPGATVPFGMVQLSPDIGIPGWDRIAGYFYQDSIISGFSHMHLSGTGAGDLYDILVMPTNSRFSKRIEANNFKPYSSFTHQKEGAAPGYYWVNLLDYGIKAEMTATKRVGVHRYSYPKDSLSQLHIDLGYALNWDRPTETQLKVIDEVTIEGYRRSTGWAKDQRVYFVMRFSRPFTQKSMTKDFKDNGLRDHKLVLDFDTSQDSELVVKTAVSSADISGAYAAMDAEAPHFNFDTYKSLAQDQWQAQLQKIKVSSTDKDQKTVFYTMLYQSMLAPTLLSDANGNYKGADGNVQHVGFDRYDTFSLWDTFRAAHPLFTILHPNRVPHMVNSLLQHYKETGTLPVWSMQGNETNMMIGYHAVPVIVDAYFKGFSFDATLAYEACKASAMVAERQIDVYQKLGYIPIDDGHENWSVSKTLEYAYDDWCIAMFAKDLGKTEDETYFLNRSAAWKNLFNAHNKWIQPKQANGQFLKPFVAKEYSPYFCESNAWHYYWFVPQDITGLIGKTGGAQAFEQRLDSMFTYAPAATDKLPIFSTGMIGQYAHGNEPSHHVAYLYNYIQQPQKAQQRIRQIIAGQYKNEPNGHCGNEDCGQMSSWYIFNALGMYPVNPANGAYDLGVPSFAKAEVNLGNGKSMTIIAKGMDQNNRFVKEVLLNGAVLDRRFLTHQELINGGELVFVMGAKPPIKEPLKLPQKNTVYGISK